MPGIVVGVDNSPGAHHALDWAVAEAGTRQASLTVLTVIPAMASPWTGRPLSVPDADEEVSHARQATEEAIAKSIAGVTGAKPTSVTAKVFTGFPAQALIDASNDADLVVVGSRGVGGFTALMLGSVSSQVAHHAACPVVIVPAAQ